MARAFSPFNPQALRRRSGPATSACLSSVSPLSLLCLARGQVWWMILRGLCTRSEKDFARVRRVGRGGVFRTLAGCVAALVRLTPCGSFRGGAPKRNQYNNGSEVRGAELEHFLRSAPCCEKMFPSLPAQPRKGEGLRPHTSLTLSSHGRIGTGGPSENHLNLNLT